MEVLKRYQAKHGNMNVTKQENKALHVWIANIKYNYKRLREGRAQNKLTSERIEILQQIIGFEFEGNI